MKKSLSLVLVLALVLVMAGVTTVFAGGHHGGRGHGHNGGHCYSRSYDYGADTVNGGIIFSDYNGRYHNHYPNAEGAYSCPNGYASCTHNHQGAGCGEYCNYN